MPPRICSLYEDHFSLLRFCWCSASSTFRGWALILGRAIRKANSEKDWWPTSALNCRFSA